MLEIYIYIYIYMYIYRTTYTRAQSIDCGRSTSYNQLLGNCRRNSVPRPHAARVGWPKLEAQAYPCQK